MILITNMLHQAILVQLPAVLGLNKIGQDCSVDTIVTRDGFATIRASLGAIKPLLCHFIDLIFAPFKQQLVPSGYFCAIFFIMGTNQK